MSWRHCTSQSLGGILAELAAYALTFGVRDPHIRMDIEADSVESEQRGCGRRHI
jgi:hypothetical protein